MLVNVWECVHSFCKTVYYKIRYSLGLQAQSRTAACILLAYPNFKSMMMPPTKLVVYLYYKGQILCRYSILHLILKKNPNNTQN